MQRFALGFLIFSSVFGQELAVKRVVLYKNGVGYFEHQGPVRNSQDVSIAFTSGQLNDVLKSLTVLDLDGGRITGVGYGSAAPVDRQLGDLRLPIGEKTSLTEFLAALRGAKLEVRSATGVITGRLLSVERKTRMGSGATLEVDYVSLMTDAGEVKTTEVSPAFSVKLLDHGLAGKLDRYLDIVGANREADVRRMVISTEGSGERALFVSYISEVPVWKATYRIVLDKKHAPLLQGWAIVDNTVGQDWEKVQLSLVAGAPHSFVQNLSQPYYARRPTVALPEAMAIAPQTHEATLILGAARIAGVVTDLAGAGVPGAKVRAVDSNGNVLAEATADSIGHYELAGLPDGPVQLDVNHLGFQRSVIGSVNASRNGTRQDARLQLGSTTETVTVSAEASSVETMNTRYPLRLGNGSSLGANRAATKSGVGAGIGSGAGGGAYSVQTARAQSESSARAQELGDLFEYKLKEPITIAKNRSALVPIVQSPIAAEKVSVWNESVGLARPQRALWLTNSSGLTLDGGSFSVLEEETFAGEGIFDPIRPNEKRLVSYATDLALNVSARAAVDRQFVTRVVVAKGVMKLHREIQESKTYTFRNEDTSPRSVIIEHPVRNGYELRGDLKPIETTSAWMRFRVVVESKQTASAVVSEARPVETDYQLTNINADDVAVLVQQKSIDRTIEDALRKILDQKARIHDIDTQKEARDSEKENIFNDQQRLRENIKSLKGSPEEKALLQRYTRQLNDQEDRLEKLEKTIADLESRQEKEQTALDEMIQSLSFDVKM